MGFDYSGVREPRCISVGDFLIPTGAKDDPIFVVDQCPRFIPTGFYDIASGLPIMAKQDCINGDGQPPYPLGYFNENGVFILTNANFTQNPPAPAPTSSAPFNAFETLANGVVEELLGVATIVGGISTNTYQLFGSGAAYTPVDASRVSSKPIKVQMGFVETDVIVPASGPASTMLSGIPTGFVSLSGQNFPQNAVVSVQAGGDGNQASIAYTTDGSDPSDVAGGNKIQVSAGQSFTLDTYDEIINCRLVPIDGMGNILTSGFVKITAEYNNVGEGKDAV